MQKEARALRFVVPGARGVYFGCCTVAVVEFLGCLCAPAVGGCCVDCRQSVSISVLSYAEFQFRTSHKPESRLFDVADIVVPVVGQVVAFEIYFIFLFFPCQLQVQYAVG